MRSAGRESTKGRRLKAHDGRRLATYGLRSEGKGEEQGLRAPRGEDLRPIKPVGWQPTARVARTHPTRIDWVKA